ncbi:hypothetical protein V5799_017355 [Amblyomma americanum]|uniref:Uncharacterized protein n=1 Tax=Amblyomma americanum TaxID=6943 RepID=A0AAQ4F3I7_AMBAM
METRKQNTNETDSDGDQDQELHISCEGASSQETPFKKPSGKTKTKDGKKKKRPTEEGKQAQDEETDLCSASELENENDARQTRTRSPSPNRTEETDEEGNLEWTEKKKANTILSKIAVIDKEIFTALVKISTLSGGNEEIGKQVDCIINEVSKLKTLTMKTSHSNQFLMGKLSKESEEKKTSTASPTYAQALQGNQEPTTRPKETKALISSTTMRQKDILEAIKNKFDPLTLGIRETTMRPGREGVVVTSRDQNSLETQGPH